MIEIEGDTARVELTQGKWAVIDAADEPLMRGRAWYANSYSGGLWYARGEIAGRTILMHREILRPPEGMVTDHIDGDGLNNRRANLRPATHRQNLWNSRARDTKLPRGVRYAPLGAFSAWIWNGEARVQIGTYATIAEAQAAFNSAARELHGEFARPDERVGFREDPERVASFARRKLALRKGVDPFGEVNGCTEACVGDYPCAACAKLPASPDRTRREIEEYSARYRAIRQSNRDKEYAEWLSEQDVPK